MRQRIDVPRPIARKLERLALREQAAQEKLAGARDELAAALAEAHSSKNGSYSIGALADAIGWSKTATHALINRAR